MDMTVYITDGSLEGLLSAIYEMYYSADSVSDILREKPPQLNFSIKYKNIESNYEKAQKVFRAIHKKISERSFQEITYAWLSELPFCGKNIAEYVRLAFKIGYKVDFMASHTYVLPVHRAASKVRSEVNRMLGLCRFSKTKDGYYYCEITPDHNILSLISPHFAARMCDVDWVILDKTRKLASLCQKGDWFIASSVNLPEIELSCDEKKYQTIWKIYFDAVAIEGRMNPKLQKKFVPLRYRKNITEFIL